MKIDNRITVTDGATDTFMVRGVAPLTVMVDVGAGVSAAQVEWTLNSQAEIDDATAIWVAWDKGSVAADTGDGLLSPVRALRFSSTGGTTVFHVMG